VGRDAVVFSDRTGLGVVGKKSTIISTYQLALVARRCISWGRGPKEGALSRENGAEAREKRGCPSDKKPGVLDGRREKQKYEITVNWGVRERGTLSA